MIARAGQSKNGTKADRGNSYGGLQLITYENLMGSLPYGNNKWLKPEYVQSLCGCWAEVIITYALSTSDACIIDREAYLPV
jgi:hypothetical protein